MSRPRLKPPLYLFPFFGETFSHRGSKPDGVAEVICRCKNATVGHSRSLTPQRRCLASTLHKRQILEKSATQGEKIAAMNCEFARGVESPDRPKKSASDRNLKESGAIGKVPIDFSTGNLALTDTPPAVDLRVAVISGSWTSSRHCGMMTRSPFFSL